MGKDKKDKDDGGLFKEPKCPPHKNTRQNEHQIVCNDCGAVIRDAPH